MARQWYEQAAAQGHAGAQYNLGVLYGAGQGVSWDYVKSRQLLMQAAAQGNAKAQYALGVLYEKGYGVPQDNMRAYMWYSLAAPHLAGEQQKFAADMRDKLASIMNPAQIAEAQKLVQEWKTKK